MNRKERRRHGKGPKKTRPADPAVAGLLKQAYADLESGDVTAAERGFLEVTERAPLDAEAFHMLALIAYRAGRLENAGEMILEAITRNDNDVSIHANCGAIMNLLGRAAEAEAASRHVIDLDPTHADAHNNLAVALEVQGRLAEALEAGEQAVQLNAEYVEAHITLGNIKMRSGDAQAAVESYNAALTIDADNVMARANLGVALREQGKLDAAEDELRRAMELSPAFAEARNGLGNVLVARGDLAGAVEAFREAIAIRSGYLEARLNLAAALFRSGDEEGAAREYAAALERNADLAEAHAGLGVVRLAQGRLDDAVAAFRKAMDAKPTLGDAALNLATARADAITDDEATEIGKAADNERTPKAERVKLHFALGEIARSRGGHADAFRAFEAGNGLRRALLAGAGHVFDPDAHDRRVEAIIRRFSADVLAQHKGWGDPNEAPVFIVGMPRSGTTLVEQIASSHADVAARGETGVIGSLAAGDDGRDDDIDEAAVKAAASDVVEALELDVAGRVTEKTPFNFLHLGLIQILLPGARIVHCVRDPLDVGLSCYFQNFTAPHPWSCDLGHIGRYAKAHDKVMAHWRGVLDLPLLEVRYEDLVDDLEGGARRLIEFLGLDWDPACLDFHTSGRTVLTAANWQVRKPLYKSAVGRAGDYDALLGPLKDALKGS